MVEEKRTVSHSRQNIFAEQQRTVL